MVDTFTAAECRRQHWINIALFVAVVSTAISLSGALAHVFELSNKIALPQDEYFTVQKIYLGWWQFAYAICIQIVSIAAVMILARRKSARFWCALTALLCVLAAQIIFWVYTQPTNAMTQNWTLQPDNWQSLRSQWEYSHAVGALFQLLALFALVIGSLARERSSVAVLDTEQIVAG